jgi:hypothetical protein
MLSPVKWIQLYDFLNDKSMGLPGGEIRSVSIFNTLTSRIQKEKTGMKLFTILLLLTLLFVGCNEPVSQPDEDHDVAYCVDKDGKVVEEENCEEDSETFNPALFYWVYFPRTNALLAVGSPIPDNYSKTPRANVTTYKASVVNKTTTYRFTPAPPRQPGWGVKASTPPRTVITPSRPMPARPSVAPRGR